MRRGWRVQSSELARLAGISVDTLRYYERNRLLPAAQRSSAGYRLFQPEAFEAAPTVKDGFRIDNEVAVYLSNVSKLSPKSYEAYTRSLELFRQSCKKIYVHQIT
jgi:DNA-binding transcriptional MerR regulator